MVADGLLRSINIRVPIMEGLAVSVPLPITLASPSAKGMHVVESTCALAFKLLVDGVCAGVRKSVCKSTPNRGSVSVQHPY